MSPIFKINVLNYIIRLPNCVRRPTFTAMMTSTEVKCHPKLTEIKHVKLDSFAATLRRITSLNLDNNDSTKS